ncbi:MAG: HAD family hydrolase [Patescibacteria group bacterium]
MTIIFDLDHTLFFADRFLAALARSLRPYGISASKFARTYALLRRETNGRLAYSPERHLAALAKNCVFNIRGARRAYETVLKRASRFLDPQAAPMLQNLRAHGHRLVLLTRGETRFQNKKIAALDLHRYFHGILVSPHKKHLTLSRLPLGRGALVFINDNAKELHEIRRILPHAILIERRRRGALRANNSWPTFRTLPAIGRAIERLHVDGRPFRPRRTPAITLVKIIP